MKWDEGAIYVTPYVGNIEIVNMSALLKSSQNE